jgi:phage terminase large subunit-like protein
VPTDRPTRVWIIGLSHGLMEQTIQPYLFDNGLGVGIEPFIPASEIEHFDKKKQVLVLKNGSVLAFISCDAGREKAQGGALDLAAFDECPPRSVFNEVAARLAAGRRLYIRMAATLLPPPGMTVSTNWLFEQVIKPWQRKETPDVDVFTAAMVDNPHLSSDAIAQLRAIYPPTSVDYQVRIEGKLIPRAFAATPLYHAFNARIHVDKAVTKQADPNRPLLFSFDINVRPMTAVVAQERPDGTIAILDEIFLNHESGATLQQLMSAFRQKYPTHRAPVRVYGDATSSARNAQTTQTDYDTILNELVGYPAPVETYVPSSNPFVHDRVAAVNVALLGPGGLVSLRVAKHCTHVIRDLEEVQSDGKGGILKTKNMDDPAYFLTHVSDGLGYLVWQIRPVRLDDRKLRRGQAKPVLRAPDYSFGRHEASGKSIRIGRDRISFGGVSW